MSEHEVAEVELPLESVGARLLRAREAAGMSRAQMAGVTRIPERHLAAIEAGDFGALPARTYAVGFSRSYAKALNLDQTEIVNAVREELAEIDPPEQRRGIPTFEPGDPARVPGGRLVWLAVFGVLAVLAAVFFLARSMITPGMTLPSIVADETAAPAASEAAQPPAAAPISGPVVFTALEPKVWVKFTDGAGNQLFQKELSQGESWTVPADQADVRIATARPDALSITIGGQGVAKLSDQQKSIRDVPVTAAALLARGTAQPIPAPTNEAAAAPPQVRNQVQERPRERRSAPARTTSEASLPVQPQATPTAAAPAPAPASAPAPAATAT
jgi:cytoskeleton protein RodZ